MKKRLDQLLLDKNLVRSRNEAQSLIMQGKVLVDDKPVTKAGSSFTSDVEIRIKGTRSAYVSRGGDKLAGALKEFDIDIQGVVALDVGASTGGFSDCMLQAGASKVYAIDVGIAQLDEKIRQDARVEVYEKLHAKDLPTIDFDPKPNFVSIDVSFISVRKIIDSVVEVLAPEARLLILVKPQVELEKEAGSKGGVVKDEKKQLEAVSLVEEYLSSNLALEVIASAPSVLKGEKKGNQEYFIFAKFSSSS